MLHILSTVVSGTCSSNLPLTCLKLITVSQLRILNGIEFQVVTAECLKARDATDLGQVVARR